MLFEHQRHLLVLDLDETLIYASEARLERDPDFMVEPYSVYVRPHLEGFLEVCFNAFEVGVWTSSSADYAKDVVRHIFPESEQLAFLWARDRCVLRYDEDTGERTFAKPLKKLRRRGYNLGRVVVVDDSPEKFRDAYGNLVMVRPFTGDPDDTELQRLSQYLPGLARLENVRKLEKRNWRKQI